jgi:cell division protein ZapA
MSQITVTVNARSYAITCEPGQERHVQALAAELDRRVGAAARDLGQVGEARLLVLTALMLLDELTEAGPRAAAAAEPATAQGLQRLDKLEQEAARAIESLAQRVEAVAARLEGA